MGSANKPDGEIRTKSPQLSVNLMTGQGWREKMVIGFTKATTQDVALMVSMITDAVNMKLKWDSIVKVDIM